MNNEQDLIQKLKAKDNTVLEIFYKEHWPSFRRFSQQFNLEEAEIQDIYQDAVIAVYEILQKGKLDTLEAKLSTYLFSVGKFMIFRRLKKKNKSYTDKIVNEDIGFDLEDDGDDDEEISKMREAFQKLGNQCREVLRLFYYEEKNLDEIMAILDYSSKDVLKSQKSRCLKKLKEILKTK